jgi:hypothetical protein
MSVTGVRVVDIYDRPLIIDFFSTYATILNSPDVVHDYDRRKEPTCTCCEDRQAVHSSVMCGMAPCVLRLRRSVRIVLSPWCGSRGTGALAASISHSRIQRGRLLCQARWSYSAEQAGESSASGALRHVHARAGSSLGRRNRGGARRPGERGRRACTATVSTYTIVPMALDRGKSHDGGGLRSRPRSGSCWRSRLSRSHTSGV